MKKILNKKKAKIRNLGVELTDLCSLTSFWLLGQLKGLCIGIKLHNLQLYQITNIGN